MKKVLILSDINSAHTQRWVTAIANNGYEVGLFTLSFPISDWYKFVPNVKVLFSAKKNTTAFSNGSFSKIKYIKVVPRLKKVIQVFKPDILHAHYATSYGLIGALSKFHPFIISAWGSDVMDFPNKGYFHKKVLQYNFKKADSVFATSVAIKEAIANVSDVEVSVIPFGIDTQVFLPLKVESVFPKESIVIGTIKSLEHIYGIDILIRAFKNLSDKLAEVDLRLLLVGGGSKEASFKSLVKELDLENKTIFTGKVPYDLVPTYHNRIDIFVNVSRNESFGVAVLEASACEKPVIASDIGGLKEVVIQNETGFLIEPKNINQLVEALEKLILNKKMREEMGAKGRKFVKEKYEFALNLKATIDQYEQLIASKKD